VHFKLDLPKILVLLRFCEEKREICLERENDVFKYVFLSVCVERKREMGWRDMSKKLVG
jgi:hypothetical protein